METDINWICRGTFEEKKLQLSTLSKEQLEAAVIDSIYNRFMCDRADDGDSKRIPYIGWFWRHINFSSLKIPVGDCGDFIGFMANNKWDYPERYLTEDEARAVLTFIDAAMSESRRGGVLSEINAKVDDILEQLWNYMQTLEIKEGIHD